MAIKRVPNRTPDLEFVFGNQLIRFYWAESIQTNRTPEEFNVFFIKYETWQYFIDEECSEAWGYYQNFLYSDLFKQVKESYYTWVVEKSLLGEADGTQNKNTK